jgi:hypothetical protein
MPAVKDVGEPAGEPHARFDEAAGGIWHQSGPHTPHGAGASRRPYRDPERRRRPEWTRSRSQPECDRARRRCSSRRQAAPSTCPLLILHRRSARGVPEDGSVRAKAEVTPALLASGQLPLHLSRFSYTQETCAKVIGVWPCAEEDEIAELSGERPRELGPCKSVDVEEEHEIAASGAQPLAARARLAGPIRLQRGAVGGLVVHDDDHGERRIAGERRGAFGEAPFSISSRCDRADRVLVIRAPRGERGALPASSRELARQHERRGELAGANDHHAASARGA